MEAHSDPVYCMKVAADTLFSGSWDFTAMSWEHHSGKSLETFTGHTAVVSALDYTAHTCAITMAAIAVAGLHRTRIVHACVRTRTRTLARHTCTHARRCVYHVWAAVITV